MTSGPQVLGVCSGSQRTGHTWLLTLPFQGRKTAFPQNLRAGGGHADGPLSAQVLLHRSGQEAGLDQGFWLPPAFVSLSGSTTLSWALGLGHLLSISTPTPHSPSPVEPLWPQVSSTPTDAAQPTHGPRQTWPMIGPCTPTAVAPVYPLSCHTFPGCGLSPQGDTGRAGGLHPRHSLLWHAGVYSATEQRFCCFHLQGGTSGDKSAQNTEAGG